MSETPITEIRDRLAAGTARCTFSLPFEAWYANSAKTGREPNLVHEIAMGVESLNDNGDPDGTLGASWTLLWVELAGEPTLQLRAFDDAFAAMFAADFHILLPVLTPHAYGKSVTYEQVKATLVTLGWVDATAYQSPYTDEPEDPQPADLDRDRVDVALRQVIAFADYDLHKGIEHGEDDEQDHYGEHVDRFIAEYRKAGGGQ